MAEPVNTTTTAATVMSYTVNSIVVLVGSLTPNEWAVVFGIVFGGITCGVNWYYKHKDHQLNKEHIQGKRHE